MRKWIHLKKGKTSMNRHFQLFLFNIILYKCINVIKCILKNTILFFPFSLVSTFLILLTSVPSSKSLATHGNNPEVFL